MIYLHFSFSSPFCFCG